jgi:hypothetical protein
MAIVPSIITTSTTTAAPCMVKSVTLAVGEQFNLPPGATLIAVSDESGITSTCPIPPLQPVGFYTVIIAAPVDVDPDNYYGDRQFSVIGYRLNGTDYSFTTSYPNKGYPGSEAQEGCFDIFAIADEMRNIPGILTVDTTGGIEYRSSNLGRDNGCKCAWTFKTFAAVANNLEIITITDAFFDHPEPNFVKQYHKVRPRSEYSAFRNIPPGI